MNVAALTLLATVAMVAALASCTTTCTPPSCAKGTTDKEVLSGAGLGMFAIIAAFLAGYLA